MARNSDSPAIFDRSGLGLTALLYSNIQGLQKTMSTPDAKVCQPDSPTIAKRAGRGTGPPFGVDGGLSWVLVHATHAASAGSTGSSSLRSFFLELGNKRFGGEHQARDGSCILQRQPGDLCRVDNAHLDQDRKSTRLNSSHRC